MMGIAGVARNRALTRNLVATIKNGSPKAMLSWMEILDEIANGHGLMRGHANVGLGCGGSSILKGHS